MTKNGGMDWFGSILMLAFVVGFTALIVYGLSPRNNSIVLPNQSTDDKKIARTPKGLYQHKDYKNKMLIQFDFSENGSVYAKASALDKIDYRDLSSQEPRYEVRFNASGLETGTVRGEIRETAISRIERSTRAIIDTLNDNESTSVYRWSINQDMSVNVTINAQGDSITGFFYGDDLKFSDALFIKIR